MIEAVSARLTHVGPIAGRMREWDRTECAALGRSPKEGLRIGLRTSAKPVTILIDGRPEAMLGVVTNSLLDRSGTIWMLATDEIYRRKRELVTFGPLIVDELIQGYREVGNVVAVENEKAVRFMRRLGFIVGGEVKTYRGVRFIPFRSSGSAIQAKAPPAYA